MKRTIALCLTFVTMFSLCGCGAKPTGDTTKTTVVAVADKPTIIDLGIPYNEQYPTADNGNSRVPWDMKLHDSKLYVSAGNYNDNTGPIGLRFYDTQTGEWNVGEWIMEEQIHAFCEIDGALTIPGTDSCLNAGYANYYQLKAGTWEQYAALPNAKHCFDMIRFEDAIFAGVGADLGASLIRISEDDGVSFEDVPLSTGGVAVNMALYDMARCYFLFEHENELYALILLKIDGKGKTHLIAKYDSEKREFVVFTDFNAITPTGTAIGMTHTFFTEAVTWKGQAYFTNGNLIRFADNELQPTHYLDHSIVWDLLVYEEKLYVLAGKEGESGVTTTVYCTDNGEKFTPITSFDSSLRAVSFEMDENTLYFGMVDPTGTQMEKTGSVFSVSYKE